MSSQILLSSRTRTNMRPDWSGLPADAIEAISARVVDDSDYVCFRSVCTWWRSAATKRLLQPWLFTDYRLARAHPINAGRINTNLDGSDGSDDTAYNDGIDYTVGHGLCRFPDTRISTTLRLPDGIFEPKAIGGSSLGWIGLFDSALNISLHNPSTLLHVDLPPLTNLPWFYRSEKNSTYRYRGSSSFNFPRFFASRLVLASNQPCLVMALSNNEMSLIYCQPDDAAWSVMPHFLDNDMDMIHDVIFYRGKIYAVWTYRLFLCDIGPNNACVSEILPRNPLFSDGDSPHGYSYFKTSYLVDSSGDLLLVLIRNPHLECDHAKCDDCDAFGLEVYWVDTSDGFFSLSKIDNLGHRSLFLSCNSVSVSVDKSTRWRENCIYFIPTTDLDIFGVFVFSLEDGNVSPVPGFSDDWTHNWHMIWLTPSIY